MKTSKRSQIGFALALLLLTLAACGSQPSIPPAAQPSPTPVDLTGAPASKLHQHVNQLVTIRGRFSLVGKLGPFIVVNGEPIYLRSDEHSSWGEAYSKMEGREVRLIGTLRFADTPEPPPGPLAEARAPDHFYFDAKEIQIELTER